MSKEIFDFLIDLKQNNNRDWFQENKKRYEDSRTNFLSMVEYLIRRIAEFAPEVKSLEAKNAVFRIYRDIRFSKDKTPYKTQFGAYMAPGGRKSIYAGYYLHLEPGNSFIAGGSYCPQSEFLKKIRSEIYYNVEEFKSLINNKQFAELFNEIHGNKLVRPPAGFPKDFEDIELLKFKDYTIFHPVSDKEVIGKGFQEKVVTTFKAMKSFNDFINRSLD